MSDDPRSPSSAAASSLGGEDEDWDRELSIRRVSTPSAGGGGATDDIGDPECTPHSSPQKAGGMAAARSTGANGYGPGAGGAAFVPLSDEERARRARTAMEKAKGAAPEGEDKEEWEKELGDWINASPSPYEHSHDRARIERGGEGATAGKDGTAKRG